MIQRWACCGRRGTDYNELREEAIFFLPNVVAAAGMHLIYASPFNYTAGRLAGEQATAASASDVPSSGFLRLIKCEISVGLDEVIAAAVLDVDIAPPSAAVPVALADLELPASTSPLLMGLI